MVGGRRRMDGNRAAFLSDTLFARDSGWYGFLNAADRVRPRLVWLTAGSWDDAMSLNDVVFTDVLHGRRSAMTVPSPGRAGSPWSPTTAVRRGNRRRG